MEQTSRRPSKVAGLVYVAAYAPEAGQSANDASTPFGWTEGQKQIRMDSAKFATVTSEGMLEDIAEGLPMAERKLALAVQGQSYGPMFDEKLTVAAWLLRRQEKLIELCAASDRSGLRRDRQFRLLTGLPDNIIICPDTIINCRATPPLPKPIFASPAGLMKLAGISNCS
jgi:hypothetical protein